MKTPKNGLLRIAALALGCVLAVLSLYPQADARPKCQCIRGNGCYHYLRAPVAAVEDECWCRFCENVSRHDGSRPWPKSWNRACGANSGLEGFLRRHSDSWDLACSECVKPLRGSCKNPLRHPRCGPNGSDWQSSNRDLMKRMVEIERKVVGFKPVIVESKNFYVVTDIPSLKIKTQARTFRIVKTHELAHIYLMRCEKARRTFVETFGRPSQSKPSGIFLFKSKSVAEMVQARYLGSPRTNLLYGAGGKSISGGHCANGFVVNMQEQRNDRQLHATVRHLLGHLLMSTWPNAKPDGRHLPKWLHIGAAHWLCKAHPKLRDEATFCGNETTPLSASGRNWDAKARKLAASGRRDPIQQILDAKTTGEMNEFDRHLRAWSIFDVMIADDRERFVKFVSALRNAKSPREAMRAAMKCEPKDMDQRWADRLLGRRRSAAPTALELDNSDPSAPGARDRRAIREATDPKQLASLINGLNEVRDKRTAKMLLPYLGHESTHVRETTVITLGKTREKTVRAIIREEGLAQKSALAVANTVRVIGNYGDKEATDAIRTLLDHSNWLVRANACQALAQLDDKASIDRLAQRVARDRSPKVTIAAMLALAEFEEEAGKVAALVAPELGTSAWQVRVAAAKTLARLGQMSTVGALITRMENEAGRVREECYEALKIITRDDLGRKPKHWRDWWEKELARKRGIPPRPKAPPKKDPLEGRETVARKKDEPTYYGIKVFSESLGYVLDVSGSMDNRFIVDPAVEKRLGRTYQAHTKIGIAKEELIYSIQALDPRATFNVILFNSHVRAWKGTPVPANASNKGRAISLVRNTRPEKETNYYDTFLEVFGMKRDELPGSRFKRTPDTMFFLTDGRPTVGDITSTVELLSWFRHQNRFAQLRCHVIAFGSKGLDIGFLTKLANENSGKFFHLTGE